MYYSTPVLQFTMKCHLCPNIIIIVTDPKNTKYQILAGARLKVEDYDPKDIGLIELQDEKVTEKLANDAFYKLEHGVLDEQKAVDSKHAITRLQEYNDKFTKDPFTLSQQVRKKFRTEKKINAEINAEAKAVGNRLGISDAIKILPQSRSDVIGAKKIDWDTRILSTADEKNAHNSSIFEKKFDSNDPKQRILKHAALKRYQDPFSSFSRKKTVATGLVSSVDNDSSSVAQTIQNAGVVEYPSSDDD